LLLGVQAEGGHSREAFLMKFTTVLLCEAVRKKVDLRELG
jgi:hypothetical protein